VFVLGGNPRGSRRPAHIVPGRYDLVPLHLFRVAPGYQFLSFTELYLIERVDSPYRPIAEIWAKQRGSACFVDALRAAEDIE
jgi:hypothetical protein